MQKGNRLTEIDTYTPARQCELTTTELDNRWKRRDPGDVNISLARPHLYPHIIVTFVLVSFIPNFSIYLLSDLLLEHYSITTRRAFYFFDHAQN